MEFCCIRSCKNYKKAGVKNLDLYPLPFNPEQRALWAKTFRLSSYEMNLDIRICGDHFMRKYLGNTPEVKTTRPFMLPRVPNLGQPFLGTQCLPNNNFTFPVSSTNGPFYMLQDNQEPIILHIPEVSNSSNILFQPSSSQDRNPVFLPTVQSNESASIQTLDKQSHQTFKSITIESCELYCHEEKLTPEQENYHHEEWLNYVKFTAKLQNLPNVSVANASEFEEKVSSNLIPRQEFPVLIYSNTVLEPQPIALSPVSSSVPNTAPIPYQIPLSAPSPLSTANPAVTECVMPPVQPPVFPVTLIKNTDTISKNSQYKEEEIFPFILQDSATKNMLNIVKGTSLTSVPSSSVCEVLVADKQNSNNSETETASSPALSISSRTDNCVSPDLLSHVEVTIEENEVDPLPTSMTLENDSPFLGSEVGSEVELNESNGPKIVDVISRDAGASELFKTSNNVETASKEKDNSSETNDVSESSMPKTVTQWSIFSMQKTIAVISSGSVEASIRNLLGVRLHIPPIPLEKDVAAQLRTRLREENFLTLSAWWMLKKKFLPLNPPCFSCGEKKFQLNSCYEYLDGLCWVCDNKKCRKVYPLKRPKFFERFPAFSLEELLLLTYHWACKSRIWVINYDVPVHAERIWSYFTALQELCGNSISKNCVIGKDTKHTITVEVSAVKLGNFFILCAYDRLFKVSRLQALTTEEACNSLRHIRILEEWLGNNVTLITWRKLSDEFLPNVIKVSADPAIGYVQSPGRHILNASRYLGKTMVQLFQNISHEQLTLETIQSVLNEVQWRERYGLTEDLAFWSIINEIYQLNEPYSYTEAVLGEIAKDRYYYKADMAFRLRWGPIDIVNKTSTHTTADSSFHTPQAISKNVVPASKMVVNSVIKPSTSGTKNAPGIEVTRKVHPISVISVNPSVTTLKDKIASQAAPISPRELLSIKMFFVTSGNVFNDLQRQAEKLGYQLKLEGFLFNPIRWLVKKKYIKDQMPCYVCHGPSKLTDDTRSPEKISWLCQKPFCRFQNQFKRPSFFACFGFKLEIIFAIIFHWAVQSDYETVIKAVPLNDFNIISVHRKLQKICTGVVQGSTFKIGGKKTLVEVAFVKFANCFILGAMERNSKHSRFRAFSNQAKLNIDEIRKSLISWLWEDSIVIVNSNKYLGVYCMEERINLVFADQTITDVSSKKYHTLTITQYLQNHMKTMFRTLKVQNLSAELLQIYLDELVWRERYGRTPLNAFHSIMRCIFNLENEVDSTGQNCSNEISPLVNASMTYGFPLPLPEVKIVLERLPEHVIHSYTSKVDDDDEVTIIENVEVPKKEIKIETISDDDDDDDDEEIEIINLVDTEKKASPTSSSSTNPETAPSSSFSTDPKSAPTSLFSTDPKSAPTSLFSTDPKSPPSSLFSTDPKSTLSSPFSTNPSAAPPSSPSSTSPKVASPLSSSSTSPKNAASLSSSSISPKTASPSSSSSTSFKNVPPSTSSIPLKSAASPLSSISQSSPQPNCSKQNPVLEITAPVLSKPNSLVGLSKSNLSVGLSKANLSVNKSDESNGGRYADKCYTRRRRVEFTDGKTRCMECKKLVLADHFAKLYTCSDCKRYVYSTNCQKAYARHRSYILFGRKISSDGMGYNSDIILKEKWFCSCGFGSKEGNKLASHLIECKKTTCYLKPDDSITFIL